MSASFHAAMRDSNTSMKLFTSSAVYFAIVFGAGFVFGTVRVMWLVPTVGVRVAELTELPLMLAVVFFAARWVNRRFLTERDQSARLIVGVVAFALLLLAELILGVTLGGLTPKEVFLNHDPVSGTAYYLSLCVFALMPWCLGRMGRRGEASTVRRTSMTETRVARVRRPLQSAIHWRSWSHSPGSRRQRAYVIHRSCAAGRSGSARHLDAVGCDRVRGARLWRSSARDPRDLPPLRRGSPFRT